MTLATNPETETPTDDVETSALGGADAGDTKTEDKATEAPKADEPKADAPKADDKPVVTAPEAYELKAPEGMDFDTEAFQAVEPTLRELNLSNEQAQKLTDVYASQIAPAVTKRVEAALTTAAAAQRKEWADALNADDEVGGEKLKASLADAAKVFDHYGIKKGEGVRLVLDESGLGNHADLVRLFARIGRDLGEGTFERGGNVSRPLTDAEKFYGPGYGKPQAEQRS